MKDLLLKPIRGFVQKHWTQTTTQTFIVTVLMGIAVKHVIKTNAIRVWTHASTMGASVFINFYKL